MPAPKSPEFRQRAVELARLRGKPIGQIARDLQISESCLRRCMDQADVDDGHKPGLPKTSGPSWSGCAGRAGCRPWRLRS